MRLGRTILAVLTALSLVLFPLAGASASPAGLDGMAASDVAHDCCHGSPCDDASGMPNDQAAMGPCAKCCSYVGTIFSAGLAAPLTAAAATVAASTPVVSEIGTPPFRPPRA